MCYPSPGPRCSAHARKSLTKAYREYETEPTASPRKGSLYATYREKRADYFATPAGQQWLDRQINETGDPNGSLEQEKQVGIFARAQAMSKMRESNLVPHLHSAEEVEPDHTDITELRRIENTRNKEMASAETLMEQTRDKLEQAEADRDVRNILKHREDLRSATNSFTQSYEAWSLALDEVDSAEKREEGIEE